METESEIGKSGVIKVLPPKPASYLQKCPPCPFLREIVQLSTTSKVLAATNEAVCFETTTPAALLLLVIAELQTEIFVPIFPLVLMGT